MLEHVTKGLVEGTDTTYRDDLDYQHFRSRFEALCKLAYENNTKLFVDAEETWVQTAIDEITYQNMAIYNREKTIVYNTIQLYRKDRLPEMKLRIEEARIGGYQLGFKLVRGAYMEKEAARAEKLGYENPIQDSKEDTDAEYDAATRLCFENRDIVSMCAGTHNEESSALLASLLAENNIEKKDDRFWFAQLYGMSDHISYNLAAADYNVAKYLPYGPIKEVLPYLSRRAQENSSVKGQAGRELRLITAEIKRRKNLSD
jgi:proline dehydrogenase